MERAIIETITAAKSRESESERNRMCRRVVKEGDEVCGMLREEILAGMEDTGKGGGGGGGGISDGSDGGSAGSERKKGVCCEGVVFGGVLLKGYFGICVWVGCCCGLGEGA